MISNTIDKKKAAAITTSFKPCFDCTLTTNDVEESTELTQSEQTCLERFEQKHLAYSDFDLH